MTNVVDFEEWLHAEPSDDDAPDAPTHDDRAVIDVSPSRPWADAADTVERELARRDVFVRGGQLTDPVRDVGVSADGIDRCGTPRLRMLPRGRLRELIDAQCRFVRINADKQAKPTRPPDELVEIVHVRGQWDHIRPLVGVVTYPVLRGDGSVLLESGYDPRTALLAELPPGLEVPAKPTQAHARSALTFLCDPLAQFPFETEADKAAWLAALLTPLARPAIDDPIPMSLIEANVFAAGKTLLADCIGGIVLGQRLPRRSAPGDEEEWRKAMLSIAIAADPIVLIDNVTRQLRSASLDAVLTGTAFRDRILGRNEELSLAVRTMFIVTSNNATISADLVTRTLRCRIVVEREKAEQRTGWRYQLPEHLIDNRAQYLSAAMTILAAYAAAGRPPVDARPTRHPRWARVVRDALVWAGAADPLVTQDALAENADTDTSELAAALEAWWRVYADRSVTTAEVIRDMADGMDRSPELEALRAALGSWCDDRPTSRRLGNRLRASRDRVVDGRVLRAAGDARGGYALWKVVAC